ncbi:VOC family protein [Robertkochia aurantiaca]|uniref:VOC family protein n=1 Tax=Robertkochia aurantiaca TaxID=2873700 RepID=UPI001CCE7153|nr:VOC family protein [Robertkochia sp. 3YJGBD-33]
MKLNARSIRTFIGAQDFETSRKFYNELGFKELRTSTKMSYFSQGDFGFYLQDYYVKDWIENSMVFLEVSDPERTLEYINSLKLDKKYKVVRITEMHHAEWGREFFVHDPSGVIWHIGKFHDS